ncbi:MAG: Ppx/GppA family phosphatase [SAR324 cluster bacterium]|nr:Ppx/GppA family phosphatase [SAR324 cluster bacterium]
MKRVGAIDIGSNAIRMICVRFTEDRRIEYLDKVRTPVRLGKGVFQEGRIPPETQQQLVETFKIYQNIFERNNCEEVRAYATSAFRETDNQEELIDLLESETGIRIEVISGGKEAQLLRQAVQGALDLTQGNSMMADLGGGSVEISILHNGKIHFAESFRLGTVRLLQLFPYHPDKESEFIQWADLYVEEFLKTLQSRYKKLQVDQLIITGGNARAIADLAGKFASKKSLLNPACSYLHKKDFNKILKELTSRSLPQRIEELSLAEDRADVIIPAVYVFKNLLKFTETKALTIPDVGVREGILDEMLEEYVPLRHPTEYQQMIHSAYYHLKKYHGEPKHAKTTRKLAVQIYEGTASFHQFSQRERVFLEIASILHDVGRFIRPSNHQRHSMYLIENMELIGITQTELKIICLIVRHHTRGMPGKNPAYQSLSKKDQSLVDYLTAILRVADALDQEHKSSITSVIVHCDDKQILLSLEGPYDPHMVSWALDRKKQFFESLFARKIEIDHDTTTFEEF